MKKSYKIICITLTIIYLLLAPTIIHSTYGSQPKTKIYVGDAYAYLWLRRKDTLNHYLLFGSWQFDFKGTMSLMVYDGKSKLKKIIIESAYVIIDGDKYHLPKFQSVIEMDASKLNGYAGRGSASWGEVITLPKIPEKTLELLIQGQSIDIHNDNKPIKLSVKSEVITEDFHFIPFAMNFLIKLQQT